MAPEAKGDFAGHLVVGLGNPGPEYELTRHNMGFLVVDELADRARAGPWRRACRAEVAEGSLAGRPVVLAKPLTYMNRSGDAVVRLVDRYGVPLDRLVVIHDDLDLPFGALRIRTQGGHGGHKGIRSILGALGTGEFVRVKIGIGRPSGKGDVVDYVLGPFTADEAAELPSVLVRAAEAVLHIVGEGPHQAMNRFHT